MFTTGAHLGKYTQTRKLNIIRYIQFTWQEITKHLRVTAIHPNILCNKNQTCQINATIQVPLGGLFMSSWSVLRPKKHGSVLQTLLYMLNSTSCQMVLCVPQYYMSVELMLFRLWNLFQSICGNFVILSEIVVKQQELELTQQ